MLHSSSHRGRVARRRLSLLTTGLVVLAAGSGIAADTQPELVRDIHPGAVGSVPYAFTAMSGRLYFAANDGVSGLELWKSDGTAAGTVLVKDINPGPGNSIASSDVEAVNGTLYFVADDGTHGAELWRSDGTEAGTVAVKEFGLDFLPGEISQLTNVNGRLFLAARDSADGVDAAKGDELYSTDGTPGGTVLSRDIYDGQNGSTPSIIATVGGTVFFEAQDDLGPNGMWRSDGTEQGTVLVKDLNPAIGSHDLSSLTNLNANVNGTFYFGGDDGTTGTELWRSDGTEGGTVRVKDINPGPVGSGPNFITFMDGIAYFRASDGVSGGELWRSDGTEGGTTLVKDINFYGSSGPTYLTVVDGRLYFEANGGAVRGSLWQSDGTEAGTVQVHVIDAVGDVNTGFANANGTLYFAGVEEALGGELWKSDRTTAGTVQVADISPGPPSSQPRYLTVIGDTLFFQADDGMHGAELWKLDVGPGSGSPGTSSGTVGTVVEVSGAGFGARKGRLELTVSAGKVPKKLVLKVLDWSDTLIHATVRGGFGSPVRCDATVVAEHAPRQAFPSRFQFLAPGIASASPGPNPVPWTGGQAITLGCQWLGTSRGTVTASWTVGARTVTKPCKVDAWPTTAAGGGDGAGDVRVRLPKSFVWSDAGAVLTLRNKVGTAVWTSP